MSEYIGLKLVTSNPNRCFGICKVGDDNKCGECGWMVVPKFESQVDLHFIYRENDKDVYSPLPRINYTPPPNPTYYPIDPPEIPSTLPSLIPTKINNNNNDNGRKQLNPISSTGWRPKRKPTPATQPEGEKIFRRLRCARKFAYGPPVFVEPRINNNNNNNNQDYRPSESLGRGSRSPTIPPTPPPSSTETPPDPVPKPTKPPHSPTSLNYSDIDDYLVLIKSGEKSDETIHTNSPRSEPTVKLGKRSKFRGRSIIDLVSDDSEDDFIIPAAKRRRTG